MKTWLHYYVLKRPGISRTNDNMVSRPTINPGLMGEGQHFLFAVFSQGMEPQLLRWSHIWRPTLCLPRELPTGARCQAWTLLPHCHQPARPISLWTQSLSEPIWRSIHVDILRVMGADNLSSRFKKVLSFYLRKEETCLVATGLPQSISLPSTCAICHVGLGKPRSWNFFAELSN